VLAWARDTRERRPERIANRFSSESSCNGELRAADDVRRLERSWERSYVRKSSNEIDIA
jgi:hypothetical protein